MATILVVDDEPIVLRLCVSVLRLGHHDVLEASDSLEALRLLRNRTADLALLDVMMPGMNGVELGGRIRLVDQNIKIVLMTGYGPHEIAEVIGDRNPYRTMWKPFKAESLLRMIDNVLGRSEAPA